VGTQQNLPHLPATVTRRSWFATSDHAKSQSSTVVAASAGAAAKPIRSTPKVRRGLTPDDVHNVSFSEPAWGKRGYNVDEVDGFLDRVEEEMKRRAIERTT
jgi:DivIVA domain-containing protein